jgi:hypothetical protein
MERLLFGISRTSLLQWGSLLVQLEVEPLQFQLLLGMKK